MAAAGDPGQLRLPLLPVQQHHAGIGAAVPLPFLHGEVGVRHGGQLGQMGDAQHLLPAADLGQLLRHLLGRPAADAGVHLVEHQRADGLLLCQHVFQGQHDPGQLAAGGDPGDGLQILPGVGGHQEPDGVAAVGARLLLPEVDGKADLVHVQVPELRLDALLQHRGGLFPGGGQVHPRRQDGLPGRLQLLLQPGQGAVCRLHIVQLPAALVQVGQHLLHRGAVLLFQPVQQVGPALHRVQLRRGEVERLPLVPDDLGKVIGFTPQLFQALVQLSHVAGEGADAGDGLLRVPKGGDGAASLLPAVQAVVRPGQGGEVLLPVPQQVPPLCEALLLAGHQLGPLQLVDLEAEAVHPPGLLRLVHLEGPNLRL